MFFPMVEERDIYDSNLVQQDDINSVLEFVFKKLSSNKEVQGTDEDDDQPDFFNLAKANNYFFSHHFEIVPVLFSNADQTFNKYREPNIPAVIQEITTPPPDIAFLS